MTGFYVMGGGFGHLTRTRALINTLKTKGPFVIFTGNQRAYDLFEKHEVELLELDASSDKHELNAAFEAARSKYNLQSLFIDTFPQGILGELTNEAAGNLPLTYVARRLKWKAYAPLMSGSHLRFAKCLMAEPLEPAHSEFVYQQADLCAEVALQYGWKYDAVPVELAEVARPIWLVVHSTHQEEVGALVAHASDMAKMEGAAPSIVVISDCQPDNDTVMWLPEARPEQWFRYADKIFTAAGFNTMQQVRLYLHKHVCLPMPRRFDDQFWRKEYYSALPE